MATLPQPPKTMNILTPRKECPACRIQLDPSIGGAPTMTRPRVTVCAKWCIRHGARQFLDASTLAYEPKPHMHVACMHCGFEWLEPVPDPEALTEAW